MCTMRVNRNFEKKTVELADLVPVTQNCLAGIFCSRSKTT